MKLHIHIIAILILSTFISQDLNAQDTLYLNKKRNNKFVIAIEELKETTIKYTKPETGESEEISTYWIHKIVFFNGDSIVYNKSVNEKRKFVFKRNLLAIHLTDFATGSICISYQRLSRS